MRGPNVMQDALFTVRSLDSFVTGDHPLRPISDILNVALKGHGRELRGDVCRGRA